MRFTGTFIIVVTVFVTVLITSNIIAVKPIELITLPFEFIGSKSVIIPASIIIFPVSYIVGDILTEVYGFRIARGSHLAGIRGQSPGRHRPLAGWPHSRRRVLGRPGSLRHGILGQVPWILVASFIAYLMREHTASSPTPRCWPCSSTRCRDGSCSSAPSALPWSGTRAGLLHLHIHRLRHRQRLER